MHGALLRAAPTHLRKTYDDDQDRPRNADEAPRQNADRRQKEIQTEQDDEPRHHFVVPATARLPHFMVFHDE